MSAIVQRSPEWHEMRKHMIGASDAPIIMGVSPHKTQYQLWCEKVEMGAPDPENWGMKQGLKVEDDARLCFFNAKGVLVAPCVMVSEELDWMMASFDGLDTSGKIGLEIKYTDQEKHEMIKKGRIPEEFYPQLQHQIEVQKLSKHYLMSYKSALDFHILEVERDDDYINAMLLKEQDFIAKVRNFIAPELTARDYKKRDDDIWAAVCSELRDLAPLVDRYDELKEQLKEMTGNQNSEGCGVKVTCSMVRGNVDYKQIPELKNVDLDKYRKASYVRKTITIA